MLSLGLPCLSRFRVASLRIVVFVVSVIKFLGVINSRSDILDSVFILRYNGCIFVFKGRGLDLTDNFERLKALAILFTLVQPKYIDVRGTHWWSGIKRGICDFVAFCLYC